MIVRFGNSELDTQVLELRRDGSPVPVEPQVFKLLCLLLENRDRVVSRAELVDGIWDGRIVSEAALSGCINAVRRAVGDDGKRQEVIRTLPRRGFRFVQEVEILDAAPSSSAGPVALPPSEKPSIAVLPFRNISGDPEQEYFADGLTEDIIAALSLYHSFPVIARNSSFIYKGRAVKVQDVAQELGARYVLEGSIRKGGDRVRITAQLVDAETGHHVWAEGFDRHLEDVFAVQDEITERIAGVVAPELSKAELRRSASKHPDNLDAWECYVRGISAVYEGTREGNARAHQLLERAVELDPGYSKAHIGLSYLHERDSRLEFTSDPDESLRMALVAARQAIALGDSDSDAYTELARALGMNGEYEAAVAAAGKAVEINPFDAEAKIIFGSMIAILAEPPDPEAGLKLIEEGLTLNPRDPRLYVWQTHMASAHLCLEQYEDAEKLAREAMVERPDYIEARLVRASALGFLGRRDEARLVFEITDHAELADIMDRRRIWAKPMKDKVLDGLNKAGLPE